MAKSKRYRTRQSLRNQMRTIVVLTTSLAALCVGTMFFVFHLLENEKSVASSDPMVVGNIVVTQETSSILRGTSNQLVLGFNIQTKGKTQHLNLSGLVLSARGTTSPIETFISNARVWSTGNMNYFTPSQQTGVTMPVINEDDILISCQQKLLPGNNYFWVTFDIENIPGSREIKIDAECISVIVGTLNYEPDRNAPPGHLTVVNNIPFFSTGNGDITSLDSWNSSRDGSGRRLPNFNYPGATFHIQPGHILQNNINATISHLVIERNGVLISNSAIKSDQLDVQGGGTYIQTKAFTDSSSLKLFTLQNGSSYIQKHTGKIPGRVKKFGPFSNVILNSYSSATFSEMIEWGNLIIDNNTTGNTDFASSFRNIKGDLEIRSTGKDAYIYSSATDTINIGGSMVVSGGYIALAAAGNNMVVKINREFILRDGGLYDVIPKKSGKGNVEFQPGSRVFLKAGNFHMISKMSKVILQNETVSWIQDMAQVLLPDVMVAPGCTLKVAGKQLGKIGDNRTLTISPTAMIDCGRAIVNGGGFRLEQNSTLATAHPEGIFTDTLAGAIQTQKRYYSSSANYVFDGDSSPQMTGVFKTHPFVNTIHQLEVKKDRPTQVVMLLQDFKVTGRVLNERGSINKNSFRLDTGTTETAEVNP